MAKMGRPTKYTKALSDKLCSKLASGISLRKVCEDKSFPPMRTIFKWLRTNEDFRHQYEAAKIESADTHFDAILDIVDDEACQPLIVDGDIALVDGKPIQITTAVSVAHARLRMDARKWISSKLNMKKYGDNQPINDAPVDVAVALNDLAKRLPD